ncbi:MAG: type II secretion system protein GspC, partial [Polyangiaceae bacterium]
VHVIIIAASADPDWSFAALETQAEKGKSFLRRRGGTVGGKTVKFIGWDRVWLTTGNQLCQTQMFKPVAAASAEPPPVPAPMPSRGGAPGVNDEIKRGIQRVGPNEFNVDRGVVDKIL